MKKILALLLAVGTMSVAMAQSGRYPSQERNSRDVILGQSNDRDHGRYGHDNRYGNNNFSERERAAYVQRIRHQYREKIQDVKRSRYLRFSEQRRQIRHLEMQRDQEIRRINEHFRNQRNGHYNNNRDNNRRY